MHSLCVVSPTNSSPVSSSTHSDWLERWRTALSEAPARQRLDALLARADALPLVRSLPAQDVYLLIRELGLADAAALVGHCSGEQLQAFVDLDAWAGDRVPPMPVGRHGFAAAIL